MIISHVRHGRTRRDARNLAQHLMKADAGGPAILHGVNGLAAADLAGALHAMRRLAPARAAAFHHIALSPAGDWTADTLAQAASRVVQELGGSPESHPHVIVLHQKPSLSGRGALHAHVVVAHWTGTGPALRDAWTHLRLERLARELEWDAGEGLTRGRHDRAIANALIARGRSDIAEALTAVGGSDGPPRSPITSPARQALGRKGIDDTAARRAVTSAWSASDTPAALRAALAAEGLRIEQGEKEGVWVVATAAGTVVGALDRIVRHRRAEVATFMEKEIEDRIAIDRVDPPRPQDRREDGEPAPAPRTFGGTGGAEPYRPDPGMPDGNPSGAADDPRQPSSDRTGDLAPPRRRVRDLAAAQVLASAIAIPDIKIEAERRYLQRRLDELRAFHDAARKKLALAQAPLPVPDSLGRARARADRARQASRATADAMRVATTRLDAVHAARPKGIAFVMAWIGGRTHRLNQEAAEAAEAARRARERHEAAERLASVFKSALEAETERAAAERVKAAAIRRQLAEIAQHELAVTMEAARMLRADPSLAALSITDLLRRADHAMRQRDLDEPRQPWRRAPGR